MSQETNEPTGTMLLRTLAMPADTNPNGDIFGGWIMSQMDIAGGIYAKEICSSRTVTVAVESIVFIHPVQVGDIVCCYGKVENVGTTSVRINLEVWVKKTAQSCTSSSNKRKLVTKAAFTYVAVDDNGKKQPISLTRRFWVVRKSADKH